MYTFLSVVYIIICLFLIMVVLLQAGKGGMGSAFGGGSQTVLGTGGGNFLTRLTSISAALFMILSATLAWMSSGRAATLENVTEQVEQLERARNEAAAAPAAPVVVDPNTASVPGSEVPAVPGEGAAPSDDGLAVPNLVAPTEVAPTPAAPTPAAPTPAPAAEAPPAEAPAAN